MLHQGCPCHGSLPGQSAPGRRRFIGAGLACAGLSVLGAPSLARAADPVPKTTLTPDQVLQMMREGNEQYRTDASSRGAQGRERRMELARGQAPYCVTVSCSDSRILGSVLFNRGLGELFIVRNAGNTVDTAALGSIEYGVAVLGCPLVVVLGHDSCGAVAAAIDAVDKDTTFPGVIGEMIQPIIPAVLASRTQPGDRLGNAVVANARRVAARLKTQSTIIAEAVSAGRLKVMAARYSLVDGNVEWFDAA